MKTIRKYNIGGPVGTLTLESFLNRAPYSFSTPAAKTAKVARAASAAPGAAATILEAAPLAIPVALAAAMYNTYKHPERTAYSRGAARAQEELYARQAREEAAEIAEMKARGLAYNEALAKFYEKELANGPIITNYANGNVGIIDSYNPNNGTFTGSIHYPSGSYMSGTFPHADYYHGGGVDLNDLVDATITYPNKGVFTADLRGFYGNTAIYDPGLLVQGLTQGIPLDPPFEDIDISIKQLPLEMTHDSRLGDAIKIARKAYKDSKKGSEAVAPAPIPPKDPDEKGKGWWDRTFGKDPNSTGRFYKPYKLPWNIWNFIPRMAEQIAPFYGLDLFSKAFGVPWDKGLMYFTLPDARPLFRFLEHGSPAGKPDEKPDGNQETEIDAADTLGINGAEQLMIERENARKVLNKEIEKEGE